MPASSPLHVAIIPDGNRRWAKEHGLSAWKGHEKAEENFDALVEWCRADGRVGVFTFWAFSTENWKRDEKEIEKLMDLLERAMDRKREKLRKNRIHLIHSGRRDRLDPKLLATLDAIGAETAEDPVMTLHIALDYGGKDEVTRAVRALSDPTNATEDDIHARLDHPELPDIDLIVRTSGEKRTSNFFLWQSVYAEWIFTEKYFPDFQPEDLAAAIEEYESRKRRFGA